MARSLGGWAVDVAEPIVAAMMCHKDGRVFVGGRRRQCDLHTDGAGIHGGGRDGSFVGQGQRGDQE